MGLENLKPTDGSLHHDKVLGRGYGCGHGKTSARGQKGQGARPGNKPRLGFEGGQTPLYKRFAKRGFTHTAKVEYALVNVESLNAFEKDAIIDADVLRKAGLINKEYAGVKILGDGELSKSLHVKANKFSESAKTKIEAAGGTVEVL